MADYREISQEYAKEGIKAALLVNAGAAVALLTQIAPLLEMQVASQAAISMLMWCVGVFLAVLCWIFAFISTRYVDKSEVEGNTDHLETSDRFMIFGMVAFLGSLTFFFFGCTIIACAFLGAVDPA